MSDWPDLADLVRLETRVIRLTSDRDAMHRRALAAEGEAVEQRLRIAELERQLAAMWAAYPGKVQEADGESEAEARARLIEIDEVRR